MSTSTRRRVRRLAALAAAGALLAGCGAGGNDGGTPPASGPGPRPGTISASLAAPADCLTVLGASSPGAVALAASRALFQSAPAVIVAPAVDGPELRAATEQARVRGLPLLLQEQPAANGSATPGATPSSAPTATGPDVAPCPAPAALPTATPTATPTVTVVPGASVSPSASGSPTTSASSTPTPVVVASPTSAPSVPAAAASFRDPAAADDGVACLPVVQPGAVPTPTLTPTPTATPTVGATVTTTGTPTAPGTTTPGATVSGTTTPGATVPSATESPAGTAGASTAPGTPVSPTAPATPTLDPTVATELGRLAPQAVFATNPQIADLLRSALPSLKIVAAADQLPATSPAPPLSPELTVLVPAEAELRAGSLAAAATAHAAGTRVLGVAGGDPRAGACAVENLSTPAPAKVLALGPAGSAKRLGDRLVAVATGKQIAGGGQLFFPGRRLVALYGYPGAPELGVLGAQGPQAAVQRARDVAALYNGKGGIPVVPTFEIIVTVAQGVPGPDGDYSAETAIEKIRPWIDAAEAAGVYVILDLQPGRTDFLTQAKRYEDLLKLPHVGLALDSEWRLKPGQVHLRQIGSVDAYEINQVTNWLADLTARYRLPQKLLVLHQFSLTMITNRPSLIQRDEIAMLIHMDGQGEPIQKDGTWNIVTRTVPSTIWMGWKNFYRKDTRLMSADETLDRTPVPVMISYQ